MVRLRYSEEYVQTELGCYGSYWESFGYIIRPSSAVNFKNNDACGELIVCKLMTMGVSVPTFTQMS